MGVFSKLAGKAIKEGVEGGLKGRKTKALLTRPELPPEAPSAPVARETTDIQPTPTPAEITPPTTDMAPITPVPPVAADKRARMIMLQGAKEQEIIKSQIDQPVYHTSREIEEIETFDPQKLKQKAIKGNVASGEGAYFTPSLQHSRSNYYLRSIPPDIQNKYIQKGEANKLVDAEKLHRQGKLSPEETEDLIYDAKTYEIKLSEDFNPIVITSRKGKTGSIKNLTPEERTDFLQRNPNYKFGPIIKHEGIWKSQKELEEIGFEGVIDASEKFKHVDEKGISKHEIAVWPSGLSKIDHKLVRGIGAREDPIKAEMDKLVPSAGGSGGGKNIDVPITGGRGGGKGGGGDGIGITEEDMINNPLKIEEWRKITPLKNDPATVKRRQTRKFEEEANKLDREEITLEEFKTEAFSGKEPVRKFTKDMLSDLIQPYVNMLGALGKGKVFDKAGNLNIINYKNKGKKIASGERVTGRLDIPAYQQFNVWVNQVAHEKKALYSRTTHLKDVTFVTDPEKAFEVAKNVKKKSPFATMDGLWQNTSDDDVLEMAQKYIDNPDWKQLGFDPDRASYYYDKTPDSSGNFLPVEYVEEIIQIGPFVLGKGVKYNKELLKSFNKGGVVDMRNGGRVGAAVVAASLMANGGQAISNQMDQLMSEGGEIQHMKGLPLDIFNRHFTRLVKSGLANPEYRQQALQNFDKFTDEVFKIESSKNWKAKNRLGYKGGFQFGKPDMDMTLNRLQRNYKDKWMEDARIHGDASQLTPEQQTALFVTNLFDKTLKDSKGNKLTGEGDRILSGVLKDDKGSMIEAYERLHYADTDKLDLPTRFRTNVVFRFGDDWENRIFGWAKKAKDIKNKYLN